MEQSAELRELTSGFYRAMQRADMSFIGAQFSQEEGVLVIGTDPEEWWVGYETITRVFEEQIGATGGFLITGSNPKAFSEGDVGWVADQYTVQFQNGNAISFRVTMVFHKEAGEWKIVQQHASIGVPNEQAFG
jgi:ketosteroid isomerase-like protein